MTSEEEIIGLRKQLRAAQTLIHLQRSRERQVRATRLALVAGKHAEQVDTQAEKVRAAEFIEPAEGHWDDLVRTIEFYADPENYKDQLGVPSGTAAVPADGGNRARRLLRAIR